MGAVEVGEDAGAAIVAAGEGAGVFELDALDAGQRAAHPGMGGDISEVDMDSHRTQSARSHRRDAHGGPPPGRTIGALAGGVVRDLRERGRGRRAGTFPARSVDDFAGSGRRCEPGLTFRRPGVIRIATSPSYGRQGT